MSPIRWVQHVLPVTFLALVGCGSDDEGNDRNVSPDPCDQVFCGGHGICQPETGSCACDTGYAGSDCSSCAGGFMPNGDGCVAAECTDNAQCDDGVTCNGAETCSSGRCRSGAAIDCVANASCREPSGTCACDNGYHLDYGQCLKDVCSANDECDDGLACNGEESCSGGVCRAGTPVSCQANATCQEPNGSCTCDDGFTSEGSTCVALLDVLGAWIDDWGSFHDVTYESWTIDTSVFHITQFDNDAAFLVAQNDAANEWNGDLWSRFDWTHDGADLYYCQVAYDAADEASAAANTSADRTDLSTGCAGFGWSKLSVRLEIIGSYVDDWGYAHDVTQDRWDNEGSVFHITQFDNDADFLVAQNDASNAWNAELWSRFDWTHDGAELYFCQSAYDAADEATAAANTSADRADLATGCAGFGWSKLTSN